MHTPVLLQEVIEGLQVKSGGLYIDATVGEGGHLKKILKKGGKVLGIDWDENQVKHLTLNVQHFKNTKIIYGNFADIARIAEENNFHPVDGIIFDLGLSMEQIENSGRGFSYKRLNEALDMRINNDLKVKASDLVNSLNQEELYEIFSKYSEEINSRSIAKGIVRARYLKKIATVNDLISIINNTTGKKDNKIKARIFQALRIAVNNELVNLKKGLSGALSILKKGGRIIVISFHSLEDRVVKRFIRENKLKQINKKVITGKEEFRFERSAKMRIISN